MIRILIALSLLVALPAAGQAPGTDIFLVTVEENEGSFTWGDPVNLTARPGYDNQPSFTPDGAGILFTVIDESGQADIWRYDLSAKKKIRVTETPESEYSPCIIPGTTDISVVQVEADTTQRIWRFPADGTTPRVVFEKILPVGYYAFLGPETVGIFLLAAAPTLVAADLATQNTTVIVKPIGRSLAAIPGRNSLGFTHYDGKEWWIMEYVPETRETHTLARRLLQSQDLAWAPDGSVVMGVASKLYRCVPERGAEVPSLEEAWTEIGDLSAGGVTGITRLAISPDGSMVAVVSKG